MINSISDKGLHLIKEFEGYSSTPYLDSVGIPTIGFGFTYWLDGTKVKMSDKPITETQANVMLRETFKRDFERYIPTSVNQNQFDAMCSLIWNIGVTNFLKSTLRMKVRTNPNDESIRGEFMKWNKARVKNKLVELKGLTNRRKKEADLYFS
jgi:lysozyme